MIRQERDQRHFLPFSHGPTVSLRLWLNVMATMFSLNAWWAGTGWQQPAFQGLVVQNRPLHLKFNLKHFLSNIDSIEIICPLVITQCIWGKFGMYGPGRWTVVESLRHLGHVELGGIGKEILSHQKEEENLSLCPSHVVDWMEAFLPKGAQEHLWDLQFWWHPPVQTGCPDHVLHHPSKEVSRDHPKPYEQ